MTPSSFQTAAIVVAGGVGARFGRPGGKQLAELAGRPVVGWALDAVCEARSVGRVVLVCDPGRIDEFEAACAQAREHGCEVRVVAGGDTRRGSVLAGLDALGHDVRAVVVHDGARPLATPAVVDEAVDLLGRSGADGVVVGHPVTDTVKVVSGDRVVETPDRSTLWAVQTPQAFDTARLRAAHAAARADGYEGTDDASLVERIGGIVQVFEGPADNIKITAPEDLVYAEWVLARRHDGAVA